MAIQRSEASLLVSALLAASLSTGCASRQYGYGIETAGVASSGKALIAKGGVQATTDSTFSEAAFLGSPIYIRQLHLTTAMGAVKKTSYDGAISICIKKLLVWKRNDASPPPGAGCGAEVRDLTVQFQSGPQPASAAKSDCRSSDCTAGNADHGRVFELRLPYDMKLRIALTEDVR